MSFISKPQLLLILSLFFFANLAEYATDYSELVYKGCANQVFLDPTGVYSQALSALFGSLVSQSPEAKFFKTTCGSGQTSINGLFQCRGDLSNSDCYSCVSKLPTLLDRLCGKTVAARVQLLGCYMLYEFNGFAQVSGLELLYKTCGETTVRESGFEERRDAALQVMENGVVTGHGFYTSSYQSVYLLAQCQGDLGDSDCGQCVTTAVQKGQVECGSSISGQVYLHKCFISYSYYPNGVPSQQPYLPSPGPGRCTRRNTWRNTARTVAIISGGAAGIGFIATFLKYKMKPHRCPPPPPCQCQCPCPWLSPCPCPCHAPAHLYSYYMCSL